MCVRVCVCVCVCEIKVSHFGYRAFLSFDFAAALAEEHARNARGYEAKLQEKIQERQQVFEDAFREEMENYKRHGETQS